VTIIPMLTRHTANQCTKFWLR